VVDFVVFFKQFLHGGECISLVEAGGQFYCEAGLLCVERPHVEINYFVDALELQKLVIKGLLTFKIFSKSSLASTSSGAYSIRILMQSIKIGNVVIMTRRAKMKVVIGSAIFHAGFKYIIIAAIITPTA
jgi:hypothetical protein